MRLPGRKKAAKNTGRQRLADSRLQRTTPASYSRYMQQRAEQELNTGRQIDRQALQAKARHWGNFWLKRFGLAILLVTVAVCAISMIDLAPSAQIKPLATKTSQHFLKPLSTYETAANKVLSSSILNHNKLTVDTGKLERTLKDQFPELANVTVNLPLLGHHPVVYVEPVQPALVLSTNSGNFIVADSGQAVLKIESNSPFGKLGLPVVTDQSNLPVKLREQSLTSQDVNFIKVVIAELAVKHFTVTSLVLPAASRELDVHILNQPYFVKFNLENDDPRQQAGTFLATIANLTGQNVTPGQYVDVRVDGRAYFK
ncbi:MAG TPA: hypothetical protein VHB51_03985 [Candidatus Saccharimonadales bacterium]|nr:hypothetical protein [Candidatus Saccharimonadales bacterium]